MTLVDPIPSCAALERRFGPSYRWRVPATVTIGTVASIGLDHRLQRRLAPAVAAPIVAE